MPRLGIKQTLEYNLTAEQDNVKRNLSGTVYRITRGQRMRNLEREANKLNGRSNVGPEL